MRFCKRQLLYWACLMRLGFFATIDLVLAELGFLVDAGFEGRLAINVLYKTYLITHY